MSLLSSLVPAFRLSTLPLALSAIMIGSALAYTRSHNWHMSTFLLTVVTAFSLQILSNIANDYGDGIKGTDRRQLAAQPNGLTKRVTSDSSESTMRLLLIYWGILTLLLGFSLVLIATNSLFDFGIFLALGLLSMLSAVMYTVGRYAYGYFGLGDISVFIFFGLIGVLGSYYLQVHQFDSMTVFPAISVGALCVAVLNINNLRDIDTDLASGKHTFALCVGKQNAKRYHVVLVACAFIGFAVMASGWAWLYLLTLPLFAWQARRIYRAETSTQLGIELPRCVKLSLACCFLFSLGLIL